MHLSFYIYSNTITWNILFLIHSHFKEDIIDTFLGYLVGLANGCNINPYEFWTGNNGEEKGEVGKKKSRFLYIINAPFCFSFSNVPSNYFCFVLSSSSQIHSSNPFYTSCEFSPFLSFSPLVVLLANKMGRKKGRGRREERRDSGVTLWNLSVK